MDSEKASNTSITKVNINGKNIYIKTLWVENENELFRLKIFDGNESWSGRFSNEFAKNCRSMLDETEEEYKINVMKAFLGTHDGFVYDFVILPDESGTARFSWKKVFEDLTVMAHGSVPVHRDDVAATKDSLVDFLLEENKDLKWVIDTFKRRNDALTENLDKCKREMEEFVSMKTQLETNLYGKFVQLLNEKKKRIRLLEENIHKFE